MENTLADNLKHNLYDKHDLGERGWTPPPVGYVDKAFAKAGTEMVVETRGKRTPAVATKMPFINTTYYRPE